MPLSLLPLLVLLVMPLPTRPQGDPELRRSMEQAFLGIMGLDERPRIKPGPLHIPQRLKDLYEQMNDMEPGSLDRELAERGKRLIARHQPTQQYRPPGNTIRSFYFQDSEDGRFRFDLSSLPLSEHLHAAELYIRHHEPQTMSNHSTRINIYQVVSNSTQHGLISHLVETKRLPRASGWQAFDVSAVVKHWRNAPHSNHGLDVQIQGEPKHVRLRRSADTSHREWITEKPYLVTYTDDVNAQKDTKHKNNNRKNSEYKNKRRTRRRTRKNKRRNRDKLGRRNQKRRNQCRRHSLLVDMEEVGWDDWIVAPPSYDAYYCHGECPFALSDNFNASNHAVVQNLVHSMNPAAVPKPCCVPTELSSMSMLYFNKDQEAVLKEYQDMVVVGCGCR